MQIKDSCPIRDGKNQETVYKTSASKPFSHNFYGLFLMDPV